MNKQELIRIYKERKNRSYSANLEVAASRRDLFNNFISDLEALEEPVKKDYFKELMIENAKNGRLEREIEEMKANEPEKVKVPAFVTPFIDKLKTTNRRYGFELERTYESSEDNDLRNWIGFNENVLTVFKALENGYEVEEEPLYTVTINLDSKYHLVLDEGDGDEEISTTLTTSHGVLGYRYFLTEKEIKSIDERYWAFASPVKESGKSE